MEEWSLDLDGNELLAGAMALLTAVLGAVSHLYAKKALDKLAPPTFLFFRIMAGLVVLACLAGLSGECSREAVGALFTGKGLMGLGLSFFFAIGIGCTLYFTGLKLSELGIMSALINTSPLFLCGLTVTFLHEALTPTMFAGELTAVAGVVLLGLSMKREPGARVGKRRTTVALGLSAAVMIASGNFWIKYTVDVIKAPVALVTFAYLLPGLLVFGGVWLWRGAERPGRQALLYTFLSGGLSWGIGLFTFSLAMRLTEFPSMVSVCVSTHMVFSVLVGRIFLGEALGGRKLLAFGLVFAGILLVVSRVV